MKREAGDYVEDIIDAMDKAVAFVRGLSYEEFAQDDKTVYAVVRALEIIGEAVKRIPHGVRRNYPEIPWKDMAGMRDKVAHEYFGVKLERVWETVQSDIPGIKAQFEKILRDLGQ